MSPSPKDILLNPLFNQSYKLFQSSRTHSVHISYAVYTSSDVQTSSDFDNDVETQIVFIGGMGQQRFVGALIQNVLDQKKKCEMLVVDRFGYGRTRYQEIEVEGSPRKKKKHLTQAEELGNFSGEEVTQLYSEALESLIFTQFLRTASPKKMILIGQSCGVLYALKLLQQPRFQEYYEAHAVAKSVYLMSAWSGRRWLRSWWMKLGNLLPEGLMK
jgi:hypothetical protein